MLTRGRVANHLYLQVVGDSDQHTLIRPETVAPRTPTETLQQILARDDAPTSATTLLRELSDPAARLYAAVQRYTDGLNVAVEQLVGPQIVHTLNGQAEQVIPELTSEPSWPTLRAHLLALAAETGEHPLLHLQAAATGMELYTAGDMAAVLDWRLPEPAPTDPGPLPGFPAYRQHCMIITFGASIWRSGRSSLSASQIRFETAPARTANSRYGHRRAATRPLPSSVKSPSGAPQSASTPKTADQPEQHSCRRLPPSGNTTSIAVSPSAPTTTSVALTSKGGGLLQAGTKIDTACPDHPRPARTHHARRPFRSTAAKLRVWRHQIPAGQKATPGGHQLPNLPPSASVRLFVPPV
jgi:hypothetical protein